MSDLNGTVKDRELVECGCGARLPEISVDHLDAEFHQRWLAGGGKGSVLLCAARLGEAKEGYEPCGKLARFIYIGASVCREHLLEAYR